MDISKLCRNDEAKICSYCSFASKLVDDTTIWCKKRGTVSKCHTCRKYKYDPLKRTPPARVKMRRRYSAEDFDI